MEKLKKILLLFLIIYPSNFIIAQYEISGKLNNYDSLWINKIYLSIVEPDKSYSDVSEEQIINSAIIDKNGYFTLKGNILPESNSIIRLNLVKDEKSKAAFYFEPMNYLLLIANNQSIINIEAANFSFEPLNYTITGNFAKQNNEIRQLELLFRKLYTMLDNPYATKGKGAELAKNKWNNKIKEFCNSNNYPLVNIFALQNIDIELDYLQNSLFYENIIKKLKKNNKNSTLYIKAFEKKIDLIKYKNKKVKESKYVSSANLFHILSLIIVVLLLAYIVYLKLKISKLKQVDLKKTNKLSNQETLINQLTKREKEIFELIIKDYQNKEIASELNLEISTIKTHLSKIYNKLGIENRKQAKIFKNYTI